MEVIIYLFWNSLIWTQIDFSGTILQSGKYILYWVAVYLSVSQYRWKFIDR